MGVIEPGAKAAAAASDSGRIGVIGTEGTIRSGAYERAILRLRPEARIAVQPCPLFVSLAEEGGISGPAIVARDSGASLLVQVIQGDSDEVSAMPPEEAGPLLNVCRQEGVDLIFLVAPTTTGERMKKILSVARGFLYVVSLLGTTGARKNISDDLKPLLIKIRRMRPKIPLAVGFGVSRPEQAKDIIDMGSDGVIVGSALVKIIEKNLGNQEKTIKELKTFVKRLAKEMRIGRS